MTIDTAKRRAETLALIDSLSDEDLLSDVGGFIECGELASQLDADEREAMAIAISEIICDNIEIAWVDAWIAADALIAAGWTRKREDG